MSALSHRSLFKQIDLSTVANKRAARPLALTLTNFEPESRIGKLLASARADKWPVLLEGRQAWEVYPCENVVYLSPDATDVLTELDPGKIYCIGGLVDRSVSRNATLAHAASRGVSQTARLPLREYCPMHNNALNIDTVVKILLEFRSCGSWKSALEAVVPHRRRVNSAHAQNVAAPPSKCLWVGGLSGDAACLRAVRATCMALEGAMRADFEEDRPFGFVSFEEVQHAEFALTRLNRQVGHATRGFLGFPFDMLSILTQNSIIRAIGACRSSPVRDCVFSAARVQLMNRRAVLIRS